ncbi:LssY C-terminal domain-containing protein [Leifsonia sp. A12D58]|uniref:LssY C-terminal domain-containing protein n=1 Tax=Leifsonia sp. A12D58 TaxID=3397674 RepID=UPI0039E041B0
MPEVPELPAKVTAWPGTVSANTMLDWFFFVFGGLASVWLAVLVFDESFAWGWGAIAVGIVFWLLLAYLVLPRLHRILTGIYVPDYFIGRTRTSDGLLGDPVNLAVDGDEAQIHRAMLAAGWTRADKLTFRTSWKIVMSTVLRRSYDEAPVSPLYLFGRQQDFAYQQEVLNNPAKRHHVRFWKCPDGWLLPGGHRVGWLAAGTFDKSVGFSLFTLQVTHKIDANTDIERDHIVDTLLSAGIGVQAKVISDFSTGYHSRNGGGDSIQTDGDLPIIDLTHVPVPVPVPVPGSGASGSGASRSGALRSAGSELVSSGVGSADATRIPRPSAIVVGSTLIAARALSGLFVIVAVLVDWETFLHAIVLEDLDGEALSRAQANSVLGVLLGLYGLVLLLYMLLGFLVWRGHNWARVVAMAGATFSIVLSYLDYANNGQAITLRTTLASLALDILILLALSSTVARRYARRPRARPRFRT